MVRFFLSFLVAIGWGLAQPSTLTLNEAVERALASYPALRVSLEQASAAAAGIKLARTAYLPRADFLGQINRATHNNVFGLLLPQSVISSISGPVQGTNSLNNVWGSAAGVLVSWEPFDFGLRKAQVESAEAARRRAEAGVGVTRFQVATATADAFLTILAAQETVRAARAGVERARALATAVDALARAELRPGADAARARAELALAETQLIQAEQAATVARVSLAQLTGVPAESLSLVAGPLLQLPTARDGETAALKQHPLAREQNVAVEETQARQRALARSYYPRFELQATTYARGTGARTDGTAGGPFSGFGPNYQNWAAGLTVRFPALELPAIRARRAVETHRELAETARYDQTLRDLEAQRNKAGAALDGARRVAAQMPARLEAARSAEQQATARYRAGLSGIVEPADAQRLLVQAEIDDGLAKLQVWRALLGVAAANGDLSAVLDAAR